VSVAAAGRHVGILVPQWPAPAPVHAAFTLRTGGVSTGRFESLNVGLHVGDAPDAVAENRRRVRVQLDLPQEPAWLEQVHGIDVYDTDGTAPSRQQADAVIARRPGYICAVQVADCLPVLFAASDGAAVAAAHAGWRGLAAGVLEATVTRLGIDPKRLLAWLGPAIGPAHFEVGEEVRAAFMQQNSEASGAFSANARGRWQCDLAVLARQRLRRLGITAVFGGGWCTFTERERFFSHRRDAPSGRMAALVWLG
jgi:polyphenol oxidase